MQEIRILLLLFLLMPASAVWSEAVIDLTIKDVRSAAGHVRVALHRYDGGASWNDEPYRVAEIAATEKHEGSLHYRFDTLATGRYAIRLFHDLNDNQRMDSNNAGLPLEPFAFSLAENADAVVLPTLEQASLLIEPGGHSVELKLRHPHPPES